MANPVNNNGVAAPPKIGGATPFAAKGAPVAADVNDAQGRAAVGNMNEVFARNPNHAAPPANPAEAARGNGENPAGRQPGAGENEVARDIPDRRAHDAHGDDDFERAADRADNEGRGRKGDVGEPKGDDDGVPRNQRNGDFEGETDGDRNAGRNRGPRGGGDHDNGNHGDNRGRGEGHRGRGDDAGIRQNGTRGNQPLEYDFTLNTHIGDARGPNRGNSIRVLEQVMRTQDVHISLNSDNHRQGANLPAQTAALLRSIESHLANVLSGGARDVRVADVAREIAANFAEQVGRSRAEMLRADAGMATRFSNLSTDARVHAAASMLPAHFPEDSRGALLNFSERQVVQGFYLARGLAQPAENAAPSPLAFVSREAFAGEIKMSQLRDVSMIVKALIVDAAAARSTANLDLAVQKFVRMLVANNEIGVLLATIRLATQPETAGAMSRTLALTKIYDLINRLAEAGRNAALNESKAPAARDYDDLSVSPKSLREDVSVLRQHLEFNPAFAFDRTASAFHDPRDAREAQRDFVEIYRDEIDEWLRSGRHRLVKEFDFGRPVGVVVEKGGSDIFEVAAARFVLVRDGSVQGWHFMKAFLVR